jgi:hypothetical protein
VGAIAFLRYPLSETTLVISGLYSIVVWIAGNQASHIHFLRIARRNIHPCNIYGHIAVALPALPDLVCLRGRLQAGYSLALHCSGASATFDSFGKACLTGQRVAHQHLRYRRFAYASSLPCAAIPPAILSL